MYICIYMYIYIYIYAYMYISQDKDIRDDSAFVCAHMSAPQVYSTDFVIMFFVVRRPTIQLLLHA